MTEATTTIGPQKGWQAINFSELWKFRELFYFFAWRDIKVRYKQTVLGALWAVLQPFLTMVVFTVVFGTFAKVPSDNIPYPIFVYSGLLFWNYFSTSVSGAANSMIKDESMIKKVYFPRLTVPFAAVLMNLVDFFFASLVFMGMMIYYQVAPTPWALLLVPLALAITTFAASGLGLLLAAVNVKYRDVRHILPFFIQLLIFVTPVIYPVSITNDFFQKLIVANPMTGVIEAVRAAFFGGPIPWQHLIVAGAISVLLLVIGAFYFRKTEKFFADLI